MERRSDARWIATLLHGIPVCLAVIPAIVSKEVIGKDQALTLQSLDCQFSLVAFLSALNLTCSAEAALRPTIAQRRSALLTDRVVALQDRVAGFQSIAIAFYMDVLVVTGAPRSTRARAARC